MDNRIPIGEMREKEAPRSAVKTLKRLFGCLADQRAPIIGMLALLTASTLLNLLIPELIGRAVDTLDVSRTGLAFDRERLTALLLLLAGIFLFSSLFSYFQGRLSAKITRNVSLSIRKSLSEKLIRMPVSFFDSHRSGDMAARLTDDIDNIATLISRSLGTVISAVIVIVGCLVIMLIKNPLLTLVCLSTVALNIICTAALSKRMFGYFRRQQKSVGDMNSHIEQSVAAKKTIDAYQLTEEVIAENERLSDGQMDASIKARVLGGAIPPLMCIIGNINFLLIVAVGALLYINGGFGVTIGTIQAFTLYSRQFTKPINEFSEMVSQLMSALASAERVFEIIDAQPEEDDGMSALEENESCSISFEHVTFSYVPGVRVLDDFSLDIQSGQRVALVGRTGAGKTTLIHLLMRFYEPDSGRILIDGTDIRDIEKSRLRKTVTAVLQNAALIDGTVRDNIAYGDLNADEAAVENAAKITCASDIIDKLENGMDTEVSHDDSRLSRGEIQLICLARASLTKPRALVLDEAMSSVDSATEAVIRRAMLTLMQGKTCIVIAHRLSTITNADKIAVFQDGRVAELGDHRELLAKKGIYYKLYQNQCINSR